MLFFYSEKLSLGYFICVVKLIKQVVNHHLKLHRVYFLLDGRLVSVLVGTHVDWIIVLVEDGCEFNLHFLLLLNYLLNG